MSGATKPLPNWIEWRDGKIVRQRIYRDLTHCAASSKVAR